MSEVPERDLGYMAPWKDSAGVNGEEGYTGGEQVSGLPTAPQLGQVMSSSQPRWRQRARRGEEPSCVHLTPQDFQEPDEKGGVCTQANVSLPG